MLNIELSNLNAFSSDIIGASLVSICGISLASTLPEHLQTDWIAAMSAATLSLGMHTVNTLALSDIERVIIKGRQGYTLTLPISEEIALTVMVKSEADLDKLIPATEHTAKNLAALVKAFGSDISAVKKMPAEPVLAM